jgi:hypothetical protein
MTNPQDQYKNITAHELVAATAVGLAEEIYQEVMSSSNLAFKQSISREDFVKKAAPELLKPARNLLGSQLNDPLLPDSLKEQIAQALILDNSLPKTGTSIVKKDTWH